MDWEEEGRYTYNKVLRIRNPKLKNLVVDIYVE